MKMISDIFYRLMLSIGYVKFDVANERICRLAGQIKHHQDVIGGLKSTIQAFRMDSDIDYGENPKNSGITGSAEHYKRAADNYEKEIVMLKARLEISKSTVGVQDATIKKLQSGGN